MNTSAPMSGWPTREIELLIAAPSPEKRPGTEPINVLVSGATTHEIPSPNRMAYGNTSMNTSTGGISVDGSVTDAVQAAESTGRRAYHRSANDIRIGPATRNR